MDIAVAKHSTLSRHFVWIFNYLYEMQCAGNVWSRFSHQKPEAEDLQILEGFAPERDLITYIIMNMVHAGSLGGESQEERYLMVPSDCRFSFVSREEALKVSRETGVEWIGPEPKNKTVH